MTQTELEKAVGEILIEGDAIQARIGELGAEISADYAGRDLLLVGVLKGAVFFLSDLMRHLTVPVELDFMAVSSYGSSTDSSGVVRILKDLDASIENRHVLIVEDIVDSGLTLSYLFRMLGGRGPASLEVCALLNVEGYYDGIAGFLANAVQERFLREEHREMLMVEREPRDLIERLREFEPDAALPKWIDREET